MSKCNAKPGKPLSGKINPQRRKLLIDSARAACGVSLFGLGIGLTSKQAASMPADAIRPPGALSDEKQFTSACSRCGQCVRDCPFDILKLAELGEDIPVGTPYFSARTGPCEMCEDIPCVAACPTGALDKALSNINDSRMGLAVLIDQEACIAYQGLRCEVCYNVCPVRGDAISLRYEHNSRSGKHARVLPIVHSDGCTGCGLCEEACILDEASIKVIPAQLAKGELGRHYRLGWEKKQAAGKSLVTPDTEHRYNLPEGLSYDHGGEGLVFDSNSESAAASVQQAMPEIKLEPKAKKPQSGFSSGSIPSPVRKAIDDSPFLSNPLDTLKRSLMDRG